MARLEISLVTKILYLAIANASCTCSLLVKSGVLATSDYKAMLLNNAHFPVRQRLTISKIASVSRRIRGCVWSSNERFKQQTSRYILYLLAITPTGLNLY